jgi:hypothetical protein
MTQTGTILTAALLLTTLAAAHAHAEAPEWCEVTPEQPTCTFACYADWFISTSGYSSQAFPWLVGVHAVCGSGSSCVWLFHCDRMDLNGGLDEVGYCSLEHGAYGACVSLPNY